jgi:hypothetical protein
MSFFFQKCHFFFKNGEKEGKTGPIWGAGTSGRGKDIRNRCKRGEYGGNNMYSCMKMKNETC